MPTGFASYDLNQDGMIGRDEWSQYYGSLDAGPNLDGPYYPNGKPQPGGGGSGGFDIGQILDFFSQLTGAFGDSGFEFTPEMLESFGVILPAMGMYGEFSKAQYQQDALAYMREELGIKGQELALAQKQLEFESGPAWDWYVNDFFPASQAAQKLQWETQATIAGEDTRQALERTLQAREGTAQAKEATAQSKINSEIARYRALSEIGMGRTNQTSDGRNVRGSGFTYSYQ